MRGHRQSFGVRTSRVAQWLACWAHNPKVRGSKPRSAKLCEGGGPLGEPAGGRAGTAAVMEKAPVSLAGTLRGRASGISDAGEVIMYGDVRFYVMMITMVMKYNDDVVNEAARRSSFISMYDDDKCW